MPREDLVDDALTNTLTNTLTDVGSYADNNTSVTWTAWSSTVEFGLTSGIWQSWTVTSSSTLAPPDFQAYAQPVPTPEELAENERWRATAAEAEAAAERLLREHLDAEQVAQLERDRAFVVSVSSGRRYKIKRGRQGNVVEIDARGRSLRKFCIHADLYVPDPDTMLAQKLLLETDEAAFHRIANITEAA